VLCHRDGSAQVRRLDSARIIAGMKQQATATAPRVIGTPYPKGVSGNPLGRALLSRRAQQLVDEMARDFGGYDALTGVQRTMLRSACTLFARAEKSSNVDEAVRMTNCAVRVLGNLRNGRRKHTPISLDEHLAAVVAENGAL
jgi:hypothetical protein